MHCSTDTALTNLSPVCQAAIAELNKHRHVSVSVLQRELRTGYSATLAILIELEQAGCVTAPDIQGVRQLSAHQEIATNACTPLSSAEKFQSWARTAEAGCDGGDPGSRDARSIWMFGVEYGDPKNNTGEINDGLVRDDDFVIEQQIRHPYNRQGYKLLAAIHGQPVGQYRKFADLHEPCVKDTQGYYKGNLYPYACNGVNAWPAAATEYTGFNNKAAYRTWCEQERFPVLADAVRRHRPRLYIGVGNSYASEFAKACFGCSIPLERHSFVVKGFVKRLYFARVNDIAFVVIPHLSGSANGLNSDESIQVAGSFIAGFLG